MITFINKTTGDKETKKNWERVYMLERSIDILSNHIVYDDDMFDDIDGLKYINKEKEIQAIAKLREVNSEKIKILELDLEFCKNNENGIILWYNYY